MNSRARAIDSILGRSMAWHKMHAAVRQREHLRKENSLIDFDAVLLALHQRAFGVDLFLRRRQARHQLGGVVDKIVDAQEILQDYW